MTRVTVENNISPFNARDRCAAAKSSDPNIIKGRHREKLLVARSSEAATYMQLISNTSEMVVNANRNALCEFDVRRDEQEEIFSLKNDNRYSRLILVDNKLLQKLHFRGK